MRVAFGEIDPPACPGKWCSSDPFLCVGTRKTNEKSWKGIFIGQHFSSLAVQRNGEAWVILSFGEFVDSPKKKTQKHERICKQKENVNFVFYRSLTFNFHLSWVIVMRRPLQAGGMGPKRSIKCRSAEQNFLRLTFYPSSPAFVDSRREWKKNTNFCFPFSVRLNIRAHFLPSISH